LAERSTHPALRLAFAIAMIVLCLATVETAMRYEDWPPTVFSGWRATSEAGPVNQYGWRGQPRPRRRPADFVVVMTGGAAVECVACPPDETLDLILERALRRYNQDVRVITLGSRGYSQDQEYLALTEFFGREHADLVVTWASIADDVPNNTFRSGQPLPGDNILKPTFAWRDDDVRGPTEAIGEPIYHSKLSTLVRPLFIDVERNWTILLPRPDPGAAEPRPGIVARSHVEEPLEQQRTSWSIWFTPRPARVQYGIDLTRGLLRHMREIATLNGARFALLLTSPQAAAQSSAPVALEHAGHWFVADPVARDAAIAEVTKDFNPITLPLEDGILPSPEAERRIMARLAEELNQRELLTKATVDRPRH
jgi:hypothetical protein